MLWTDLMKENDDILPYYDITRCKIINFKLLCQKMIVIIIMYYILLLF